MYLFEIIKVGNVNIWVIWCLTDSPFVLSCSSICFISCNTCCPIHLLINVYANNYVWKNNMLILRRCAMKYFFDDRWSNYGAQPWNMSSLLVLHRLFWSRVSQAVFTTNPYKTVSKSAICILISGSLAGYFLRRFYLLLDKSDNIMLKMGLILILADFSIVCSVTSYQNVRPPRCLCRVFKLILVLALCLSWPHWAMN